MEKWDWYERIQDNKPPLIGEKRKQKCLVNTKIQKENKRVKVVLLLVTYYVVYSSSKYTYCIEIIFLPFYAYV